MELQNAFGSSLGGSGQLSRALQHLTTLKLDHRIHSLSVPQSGGVTILAFRIWLPVWLSFVRKTTAKRISEMHLDIFRVFQPVSVTCCFYRSL